MILLRLLRDIAVGLLLGVLVFFVIWVADAGEQARNHTCKDPIAIAQGSC